MKLIVDGLFLTGSLKRLRRALGAAWRSPADRERCAWAHRPVAAERRALVTVPFSAVLGLQGTLWPRAMLLRADLAAALGYPTEADTWYGRWLELWAKADPEFLPHVERARRARAARAPPSSRANAGRESAPQQRSAAEEGIACEDELPAVAIGQDSRSIR